ncbi:MAG TPA: glycine cleavage system protein GcvH [bacterium (Candidatus Stahlbacteria)]|nr:glycine cleavage system protein GcvH [Candidatus Stahlbacteria bacterium]
MVTIPDELRYSKDHEWVKIEDGIATEGITDYAQGELSDIVMIELPEVGRTVKQGESIGTIEAVKAVVDLYAAVSGEVVAVNDSATQSPDAVNKDPYGAGWLVKIKISDPSEVDGLIDSEGYKQLIGGKD